jgi:hypothetical protein
MISCCEDVVLSSVRDLVWGVRRASAGCSKRLSCALAQVFAQRNYDRDKAQGASATVPHHIRSRQGDRLTGGDLILGSGASTTPAGGVPSHAHG